MKKLMLTIFIVSFTIAAQTTDRDRHFSNFYWYIGCSPSQLVNELGKPDTSNFNDKFMGSLYYYKKDVQYGYDYNFLIKGNKITVAGHAMMFDDYSNAIIYFNLWKLKLEREGFYGVNVGTDTGYTNGNLLIQTKVDKVGKQWSVSLVAGVIQR